MTTLCLCLLSPHQIENMVNEIKYASFTQTGNTVEDIDLNDLIRLYVNHRPVLGVGKAQIAEAMARVAEAVGSIDADAVDWSVLSQLIKTKAEGMSAQELATCLSALVGEDDLSGSVSAGKLAHEVLGFEDYEAMAAAAGGGDEA